MIEISSKTVSIVGKLEGKRREIQRETSDIELNVEKT
jgi:hypothetical protein